MMGFIEWVEFNRKRKTKEQKSVESTDQRGTEVGNVDQQRKTAGIDPSIQSAIVHYFPEPQ